MRLIRSVSCRGVQGTPVQNTLAELFALLHFLDPTEFPDPDDAACEFGHVDAIGTNSLRDEMSIKEQVARIHELLRPRCVCLLPRCL